MDAKINELIAKIASLEKTVISQKNYIDNCINVNTAHINEIANNIDVKLDILLNVDKKAQSKPLAKKIENKPLAKMAFFKSNYKENNQIYINILYTENDIKEAYENDEVKSKKADSAKLTKVSDILYKLITKDKNKTQKLKELYDTYCDEFQTIEETVEEETE